MSSHPLSKHLILAMAVKLAIVIAAALFVFGPRQLPKIDAGNIETRLMGAAGIGQKQMETAP
jgi:Sec-independent protein translocase protein TatA